MADVLQAMSLGSFSVGKEGEFPLHSVDDLDEDDADELPEAMEVVLDDEILELDAFAGKNETDEHVTPHGQPHRLAMSLRLIRSTLTFVIVFILAAGTGAVATYFGLEHFRGHHPTVAMNMADSNKDVRSIGNAKLLPTTATSSLKQLDRNQVKSIAHLASSIGDVAAFSDRVNEFIRSDVEPDRTAAYERLRNEELPHLRALDRWNSMVRAWSSVDMRQLDPQQAARMLAEAEVLLPACGQFANGEAVRARLPIVAAVADRVDENGESIVKSLVDQLAHPLAKIPFVLQTNSGARHFLLAPPERTDRELDFDRVINAKLETVRMTIAIHDFDVQASGRLSHALIAEGSLKLLASLDNSNWESTFFRIARAIYTQPHIKADEKTDAQMDPLLKAYWLKQVLAIGCRGSQPLCEAFAAHRQTLDDLQGVDGNNWFSPGQNDGAARRRAMELLDQLPSFDAARDQVAKSLQSLGQFSVKPDVRWIGMLGRNERGEWGYVLDPTLAETPTDIDGFSSVPNSERIGFKQLGVFKNGGFEFFVADEESFFEGQPLLAIEP